MLFNSFPFIFVFLPITYVVFWSLRSLQLRYAWLALAGYVFYGYWNAKFCLLMAFSTLVSFTAGLGLAHFPEGRKRKLCLVVPITVDLALLGFFKYADFFLDTATRVVHAFGSDVSLPRLDIVLPIGISFYTFHTITYIVDSYRGTVRPTRNLFEFATYVSLFSQLVAGPIVRFRQIESDLATLGRHDRGRWVARGLSFFVVGLVEKVLVADSLAAFVDPALASYHALSTAGAWMAMLGYSLQLYFDFSGYSTMAVGLGFLFAIHIPQNFNSPYRALDPSDFWRRWHISLSSCLRDYLYIPLGGNREGVARTYRNMMITMLLGGLWHGAAWTFVVWGAYHGTLLSLYHWKSARWDVLPARLRQATMWLLVLVGWVFFRSKTFGMAWSLLHTMFVPTAGTLVPEPMLALFGILVAGWWSTTGPNAFELNLHWQPRQRALLVAASAACLAVIASGRVSPFLYFQF